MQPPAAIFVQSAIINSQQIATSRQAATFPARHRNLEALSCGEVGCSALKQRSITPLLSHSPAASKWKFNTGKEKPSPAAISSTQVSARSPARLQEYLPVLPKHAGRFQLAAPSSLPSQRIAHRPAGWKQKGCWGGRDGSAGSPRHFSPRRRRRHGYP